MVLDCLSAGAKTSKDSLHAWQLVMASAWALGAPRRLISTSSLFWTATMRPNSLRLFPKLEGLKPYSEAPF